MLLPANDLCAWMGACVAELVSLGNVGNAIGSAEQRELAAPATSCAWGSARSRPWP